MVEDHHEGDAEIQRRRIQERSEVCALGGADEAKAFREAELPEQRGEEDVYAVASHAAKACKQVFICDEGRIVEQRVQV